MPQELIWEETHPSIEYSAGWTREWGSIYHGSAVMRTNRVGDSISVKFHGSGIKLMGAQGWDHGTFSVSLDGVREIVHDGYCCGPRGGAPQIIQFEKTGLSTSEHVLNVTNFARGKYGSVLEVDAVLITPHPTYTESRFPLVLFLLIMALLFVGMRRRLTRLASKASPHAPMLPLSSPLLGEEEERMTPTALAPPPPRDTRPPTKGRVLLHDTPNAGASSSGGQPPRYTSDPSAPMGDDDALVERIAQRLAVLVHTDRDAPPAYEDGMPETR